MFILETPVYVCVCTRGSKLTTSSGKTPCIHTFPSGYLPFALSTVHSGLPLLSLPWLTAWCQALVTPSYHHNSDAGAFQESFCHTMPSQRHVGYMDWRAHICTSAMKWLEFSLQAFPDGCGLFSFEYGLSWTSFNVYVDEHNSDDALNTSKLLILQNSDKSWVFLAWLHNMDGLGFFHPSFSTLFLQLSQDSECYLKSEQSASETHICTHAGKYMHNNQKAK